jgi:hypothetical protein
VTNNTPIYWDVNGLSLHTYAWSIETKAGRQAAAAKRGDDVQIPFNRGHDRQAKTRDPAFPKLPMWITGLNQDGSKDNSMSEEAKLQLNWDTLLAAMNVEGQFPLTKRFYDVDGTTILTATAQAELLDPPEPSVVHRNLWRVEWELKLSDPCYYAAPVTIASPGTFTIEGTAPTDHITVTMSAGTLTFPGGNSLIYSGAGSAVINCKTGMAKVGSTYVNGQLTRNRFFPDWPKLVPGSRTLTGAASVTYEPAYW